MRIVLVVLALLAGCASIPDAAPVRIITSNQTAGCAFVGPVTYDEYINALGKTPARFQAIGEANIKNRAAAIGANAVVLTKQETGWFLGNPSFAGDAYRCTA